MKDAQKIVTERERERNKIQKYSQRRELRFSERNNKEMLSQDKLGSRLLCQELRHRGLLRSFGT